MAFGKPQVVETGVFASPATQADSPYELLQAKDGQMSVRCVQSDTTYDTSVLARPTNADLQAQRGAFLREIAAWLCTNGPSDPVRESSAVNEVSQALQAEYSAADLNDDRQWIQHHDLSQRVPILKDGLADYDRLAIVEFAARVGAAGNGISQTDAQFIEHLGLGLGLHQDVVAEKVVNAIQSPNAA